MSGQRWEYASVTWTEAIRKITKEDPEYEELSSDLRGEWILKKWSSGWWSTRTIHIWLPGAAEADTRIEWESSDEEPRVRLFDVYNELGADGWEMISSAVKNYAMGRGNGRETTSFPIRTAALFKRPVGTG